MQIQSTPTSIDINLLISNINTDDLFTYICQYDFDVQMKLLSMLYQPYMEPKLIKYTEYIFSLSSEHRQLDKLIEVISVVVNKMNSYSFEKFLPIITLGLTSIKFATKLLALNMISLFAKTHKEVSAQYMPEIISKLIGVAPDPKPQVRAQLALTFIDQVNTIDNVDVKHLFSIVISAYTSPAENTQKALDALIATPFVNDVDIPTMGFLVPLLTRSMKEKKMVYQRRAAVVIQTLCKLLKNPVYAKPFYPVLEQVLTRGYEEIAEPEIRQVCANSLEVLKRVHDQGINKILESYTSDQCNEQVSTIVNINGFDGSNELVAYLSDLVFTLVKHENKNKNTWVSCIKPYLSKIITDEELLNHVTNEITETIIKEINIEEHNPEDNEENLCDCVFSLAYGTRVLLHQTPFKVKLGRRYGILGSNGAGKSTLMRAISNKSLADFPNIEATFVEHHIPEEKQEMIVLDYIMADEKIQAKGVTREQVIENLAEVNVSEHMMNAPLYTLSGGNVQRVNIILAKLRADPLLLLDEPTNHIDQGTIKWLKEYIKGLKNTTCLIISHDIKFLDDVCTNIIHYENLKLKFYRGNVTEFVKQKPEAAFYFETSSQDVLSFSFPEPGQLEGVKSLTKAVLKMRDCSFQYPGTPKPQLTNVNMQVSMASRVVICGVNGSGKTTLVKLLLVK